MAVVDDLQEWRDNAHEIIDSSDGFLLFAVRGVDEVISIFPVRQGTPDRELLSEAAARVGDLVRGDLGRS